VLLEGLQSGMLNDYFVKFWDLPVTLPKKLLAPLILLLPYASKIAGDWLLTQQSLQLIVQEPVTIQQKQAVVEDASETMPPVLGECIAGLDMVCGDRFWEDAPVVEIAIGPLKQTAITEYLPTGNRYGLLQTFTRFFVPAGVETIMTIQVAPEKRHMNMVPGAEPVLGYSSYI
jgi:predicted component of type VI protein secretion system